LDGVVDLDVSGRDAIIAAEFLRELPSYKRHAAWPYSLVAVWADLHLDWLATADIPERNLVMLDIRARVSACFRRLSGVAPDFRATFPSSVSGSWRGVHTTRSLARLFVG
jgi:hypothetical protein